MKKTGGFMRFLCLATVLLLAVFLSAGCQGYDPPPGRGYEMTRKVVSEPDGDDTIAPGLYCLLATGEDAKFLLTDNQTPVAGLINTHSFGTLVWLDVREGEILYIHKAKLYSEQEKIMDLCYTGAFADGFFRAGIDFLPGTYDVRATSESGGETPSCAVFDDAHAWGVTSGRTVDLSSGKAEVTLSEGEFIWLTGAELLAPPLCGDAPSVTRPE